METEMNKQTRFQIRLAIAYVTYMTTMFPGTMLITEWLARQPINQDYAAVAAVSLVINRLVTAHWGE